VASARRQRRTPAGSIRSGHPGCTFTVSVANPVLQLRGEATGTIQQDGSSPTIDILLQSNLINLPVTKWTPTTSRLTCQPDGSGLYGRQLFTGVYAGKTWGARSSTSSMSCRPALLERPSRRSRKDPRDCRSSGRRQRRQRDPQGVRAG